MEAGQRREECAGLYGAGVHQVGPHLFQDRFEARGQANPLFGQDQWFTVSERGEFADALRDGSLLVLRDLIFQPQEGNLVRGGRQFHQEPAVVRGIGTAEIKDSH